VFTDRTRTVADAGDRGSGYGYDLLAVVAQKVRDVLEAHVSA
jgi:hypothetical protein